MFKSIISSFQSFGKAVFTRIIGFVGGIFGIKPEVVQIPAPPEISNQEVNSTATETKTEEKKEGLIAKAFKTVKKVASATIKAVINAALVTAIIGSQVIASLAIGFGLGYILGYFGVISLGIALIQTAMPMAGAALIASYGLVGLALLGIFGLSLVLNIVVWELLLKHIHKFLSNLIIDETPKSVVVNVTSEMIAKAKQLATEQLKKEEEVITAPAAIAIPTPVTTSKTEVVTHEVVVTAPAVIATPVEVVVDTRPSTSTVEKPEIVPVVIEEVVPEVVDIRPTPEPLKINNAKQLKNQLIKIEEKEIDSILMSYRASDLKKIIGSLNQFISDGLNKGITRDDKKTTLVSEIKKQLQYFNKNSVVA
jgi:uncharacterized membrane protein